MPHKVTCALCRGGYTSVVGIGSICAQSETQFEDSFVETVSSVVTGSALLAAQYF